MSHTTTFATDAFGIGQHSGSSVVWHLVERKEYATTPQLFVSPNVSAFSTTKSPPGPRRHRARRSLNEVSTPVAPNAVEAPVPQQVDDGIAGVNACPGPTCGRDAAVGESVDETR